MSLITITDAQRYNLGYTLAIAHTDTQVFLQETQAPSQDFEEKIAPTLQDAVDALSTAGYGPSLPDTTAQISSGDTLDVSNSDGTNPVKGTVSVTKNVATVTLPDSDSIVGNGGALPVVSSAGTAVGSGTVTIKDGVVSNVMLPATVAAVANSAKVTVQNSAGATAHDGTATVASGAISAVKLAATAAIVDNSQELTVPVTGTYATKATLTVANGVVTAIALS